MRREYRLCDPPATLWISKEGAPSDPLGKISLSNNLPLGDYLILDMFHLLQKYTTESVTSGHPDKVCDQISDAILDACLAQDPHARVAVESFGSHGTLMLGGEIKTSAEIDPEKIARDVYASIGYTDELKVLNTIAKQSPDIAQGVDIGGAGDQGIMYGYATDETKEFLPEGAVAAHALARQLEKLRRDSTLPWLRPDGKTQVTIDNGRGVVTALTSTQHAEEVSQEEIRVKLIEHLFAPVLGDISNIEILVNPTGKFVIGGFAADFADLRNVWFVVEPQPGGDYAAHTLVLFEFAGDRIVGLTVEARLERGETYDAIAGMFNQFELAYVWSTARDLLERRRDRTQITYYAIRQGSMEAMAPLVDALAGR